MTGGTGALKVWSDLFKVLPTKPLQVASSSRLVWVDVDQATGLRFNPACGKSVRTPFIKGTQPRETNYCAPPRPVEPVVPSTPALPAAAPVPAPPPTGRPDPSGWIDNLMR
jgi:Membrane carboxypeptidase/penicillin-binding protein